MELEERLREFDRRVEEGRGEISERIEAVKRCCEEAEEARRRDWEELKGRLMTADEERKHQSDGILRVLAAVTDEHVRIIRALGADMEREFAEGRAESRAHTEALLQVLDRLPRTGGGGEAGGGA